MNIYALENAAFKVDGYFINEQKPEEEFIKAKRECLEHLRNALKDVEIITFEEFIRATRRSKKLQ